MTGFRPIAIVGQACLLPGAHSPDELWSAVMAGRDLLSRASAATWQVADKQRLMRTDADAPPVERIPTDRGGYVTGFEKLFDPAAHRLERALVEGLDPLFQWLLHTGRAAVLDAGIDPGQQVRGGAIIGNLSYPSYGLNDVAAAVWAEEFRGKVSTTSAGPDRLNRFMSGLPANLLCESLQLTRGGFMVDAACASSLYAIKFACDWLASGRADVMLAGGVARVHGLTIHAGFTTLQALSPSGRSRPLHAQADGLVPSEGCAVIVLKRLEDAQRDGSRILGVIRGIGLANDGRGAGLLVPSAAGQVRAMEAAYRGSGLRPENIDLIECHATGTGIGDATEIQSCAQVFAGASRVALGSLKANLGHLLPVAGVAGLIKVLKSMEHGVQPGILHLDELHPALAGTPFQPGIEAVEWKTSIVRRAAINAFGFGGNNAHLLLEQSPMTVLAAQVPGATLPRRSRCAIVSVAARVGHGADVRDFWRAVLSEEEKTPPVAAGAIGKIRLPLSGSAFPPRDLEQALAQQVLTLEVAHQALAQVATVPSERTSVFVGMGCDAEACRFGLNLRLEEFLAEFGFGPATPERRALARQEILPGPLAATTLGFMPNVVANRLNRQHGCGGASCAVSAEQLSGLHALELAVQALSAGDVDAALVGAVDVSVEPVQIAALTAALPDPERVVSDGACMLVLKREEDARRDGDTIYALIVAESDRVIPGALDWTSAAEALHARCGYCHAADALLQIASAALALKYRLQPPVRDRGALPWTPPAHGERAVRLEASGLREAIAVLYLSECADQPAFVWPRDLPAVPPAEPRSMTFNAHRPAIVEILRELLAEEKPTPAPARVDEEAEAIAELMPPAPVLQAIGEMPGELSRETIFEEGDALAVEFLRFTPDASPADWVDETVSLHECFLEEMATTHEVFLRRFGAGGNPPPDGTDSIATELPEPEAGPEGEPAFIPMPADDTRPGPKFTRADLERLASGKISELFGPNFAGQDEFHRQVRMPMPPMLLADRVTGIEAVPGELGTGTIWTETDVQPDAWYLHQGHVPLGITIEAGQADLLLISWMGIDALNRGERTYRLLGCEAEAKGPLPKVGDTLQFDIHIDGHAQLGGIRMFFFHSDLRVNGEVRLSVRHGQAGFFTDEELASSDGVLWDAATEPAPPLRHGAQPATVALTTRRAFDAAQVKAFAAGRARECFGPGFELTETHTRTPRIQPGRMCFLDEVTAFDAAGGPWGRGYLRAVKAIAPDEWFFSGHFKNDPCMPGTLMLEGAVQALAFFLAALGCTVRRDGWRFEAAKNENVLMRCRGQCVPTSRELVYEVFVEEFMDGVSPQLRASVMASVDGRKAFLCQGLAVELVQDWPLDELLRTGEIATTERGACFARDGFVFDHRSLLACALGRPSESFGPTFAALDWPVLLPRLPRPPYHFMTRVVACDGTLGRPVPGTAMECDFDFAAGDWFFERSGNRTMPSCVFMEALLQPCGWLSSYARDASGQTTDIFFRNLDGTLTWSEELRPHEGTLRVRTELTNWSELGTMIIVGFRVEARLRGRLVAKMDTAFGFFPGDAFANQAGLAPSATEKEFFAKASETRVRLCGLEVDAFPSAGAPLADEALLMLDRVTGWWPEAGEAALGIVRAEKDVKASDWFFQAHFMNDPVQPGSLGIEALVQLVQCAMRLRGIGREWETAARFEPVAMGEPLVWKYRGQVVPSNRLITTLVELLKIDESVPGAVTVRARGSLWVDGKKIYETGPLAMRVTKNDASPAPGRSDASPGTVEKAFSLARMPWLRDHRPSFTSSVIPLTVMLDEIASAADAGDLKLTSIGAFAPARWLVCSETGAVRIKIETETPKSAATPTAARLSVWREAPRAALSRFDEVGATTLGWGAECPEPPIALPALDAPPVQSPYESGETTHGPAFHVLRELRRSSEGASVMMEAGAGTLPVGRIHPALLDGCTHAMPLGHLTQWYPAVSERWNALPRGVRAVNFFGATPTHGPVRCEIRPRGLDPATGLPLAYVQFIVDGRVWCELHLELALLDAQPFVGAAFGARRAFMRGEEYQPTRFSGWNGSVSTADASGLVRYQWMPGQLEALFNLPEALPPEALALAITEREHVAHPLEVHPSAVSVNTDHTLATLPHFPLQAWPITTSVEAGHVEVRSVGGTIHAATSGVSLFNGAFLNDLSQALRQSYVRHFRLIDPVALERLKARPFVICANHQTAIESMLFTDLFTRWAGYPVTTVTRTEHAGSWMGRLTDFLWRYPKRSVAINPQLLFNRDQPESFLGLMENYKAAQAAMPHSLHLHVEGEQALSCRQRVKRMSAVMVDLALDLDLPILPLKYSGGLPVEPLTEIVSFPVGFGRQDYTLGRPLLPEQLRRMPRPKAAEWVVDTINQMTPVAETETPLAGVPERAAQIRALCAARNVTEIQAAVIVALQALTAPSETTRSILNFPTGGAVGVVAPADELAWHREVAGWLWGEDDRIHRESEHWKKTARI